MEVFMARRKVPIRQSDLVRRFAEKLRSERLARGLTQADLARSSHVTVSYISRLESGQIAPGIDLVERIAKGMEIAVNDLLPGKGEPNPLPLLHEQAQKMLGSLIRTGDVDAFTRLNPIMSMILESATRRG